MTWRGSGDKYRASLHSCGMTSDRRGGGANAVLATFDPDGAFAGFVAARIDPTTGAVSVIVLGNSNIGASS